MNEYMKRAAKESKVDGIRYVVYVPDQGTDVFNAAQMKLYGALTFIDAVFVNGAQMPGKPAK